MSSPFSTADSTPLTQAELIVMVTLLQQSAKRHTGASLWS